MLNKIVCLHAVTKLSSYLAPICSYIFINVKQVFGHAEAEARRQSIWTKTLLRMNFPVFSWRSVTLDSCAASICVILCNSPDGLVHKGQVDVVARHCHSVFTFAGLGRSVGVNMNPESYSTVFFLAVYSPSANEAANVTVLLVPRESCSLAALIVKVQGIVISASCQSPVQSLCGELKGLSTSSKITVLVCRVHIKRIRFSGVSTV